MTTGGKQKEKPQYQQVNVSAWASSQLELRGLSQRHYGEGEETNTEMFVRGGGDA